MPAFKDFGINASAAVSSVFTAAGNATSAMHSLTDSEWVVKVRYEVTGAPPDPNAPPTPPMASGGWIPGALGEPFPITAHGKELMIPASTAMTLPPDLVDQLLSGSAFSLPASMVSRLSYPVGVPSLASVAGAPSANVGARDDGPGYRATIYTEERLRAGTVVFIEEQMVAGRVHLDEQRILRADAHTRGKARAR